MAASLSGSPLGLDLGVTSEPYGTAAPRLTRTPQGWKVFDMLFQAKLGAPLRTTLAEAVLTNSTTATDDKHTALFTHIRDRLIVTCCKTTRT